MEWTDDDIREFVVLLDAVSWPAPRVYAEYVDGTGAGDGWFNDGLMKLGRYDVNLQRRLEQQRVGQNSQFFANGALNVRMLSEHAPQESAANRVGGGRPVLGSGDGARWWPPPQDSRHSRSTCFSSVGMREAPCIRRMCSAAVAVSMPTAVTSRGLRLPPRTMGSAGPVVT